MKLLHLSTTKHVDGVYDIDVKIDQKVYTYHIASDYAVKRFEGYARRSATFGRAVAVLNKWKVTL